MSNLPKGWAETTMDKLVELAQGVAINAKTNHVLCEKLEGLPLLKINNLLNNTIDQYANPKLVPQKAILKRDDIIFTRTGQVGWVFTNKIGILHNNSFKVIPSEKLNKKFLYWFLKQKSIYSYVQKVAAGSAQPDLNHGAFKTISIKYPTDLDEQKQIANILSSFDKKMELLKEQNKTLETMAQTIFKEWFVDFNYPNATGEMIESEMGEIPKGWKVGKIGDIVNIYDSQRIPLSSQERELKKGIYPYYGATKVLDYIDDFIFDGTYLLFAEDGSVSDANSKPILQYVWGKFWVNNHTHILQGKNGFSTELLYIALKNINVSSIITGAVQLKINQANLLNYKILLPDKTVLNDYIQLLNPFFDKFKNNFEQIQTLEETRDSLLPKLMGGKIRLRDFDE